MIYCPNKFLQHLYWLKYAKIKNKFNIDYLFFVWYNQFEGEIMVLHKVIDKVKEQGQFLTKEYLKAAMQLAKQKNSAELAYELACVLDGKDRRKMEIVVLAQNNPEFSYKFARDIPGAELKRHQNVIIRAKNAEYALDYAVDIPGANIKKLQSIVLESENPEYLFEFAYGAPGADIKALETELIKTKDVEYIKKFEENVDDANVRALRLARGRITKMAKKLPKVEIEKEM